MLATALIVLMTLTSQPGETMDEFVIRVAPQASAYTEEHEVEVCGAIGQDGDKFTLVLTTDSDQWRCKISTVKGTFTGFIFHTHTRGGKDGWATADLKLPGYLATPRKLLWQNKRKMRTLVKY